MMALCGFVARSGAEGGPVGTSRGCDAATELQSATPEGQGAKAPRTALAARQVGTATCFRGRLAGELLRLCHAHVLVEFGPSCIACIRGLANRAVLAY